MSDYKYIHSRITGRSQSMTMGGDMPAPVTSPRIFALSASHDFQERFQKFMRISAHNFCKNLARDLPADTLILADLEDSGQVMTVSMASRLNNQDVLAIRDLRFVQTGDLRVIIRSEMRVEESIKNPDISLRQRGLATIYSENLTRLGLHGGFHAVYLNAMDDGTVVWTKMGFHLLRHKPDLYSTYRDQMMGTLEKIRPNITSQAFHDATAILNYVPDANTSDDSYDCRTNQKILALPHTFNGKPLGDYLSRQQPEMPLHMLLNAEGTSYFTRNAERTAETRKTLQHFYQGLVVHNQ